MQGNIFPTVLVAALVAAGAAAGPREPAPSEPNRVLRLPEVLDLALAYNPELDIFGYDLRAADARLLQAGLPPNPQLEIEVEDVGGRGERRGFETAQTTVQIGQPLELGGKRARRTRVAALDKELVQWDYRAARLDVVREATRAFATVLAAQERLAVTDRLLELSRQAQAAVAQRVQAGKDSPVEQWRADVVVSESRIERQKAEKGLTAARHRLAATWGDELPGFERVAGDLYETPAPTPPARLADLIADNPDVARWATEEERRRAALRLEKARGTPDVTVAAGLRRYEETDDAALVFGLALPLPLFDRNQGNVRAATAELAKTRRQYEAARVRTQAALSEAAGALAGAYEEVTILRDETLPKARQAFEAARQGYEQGKFDYLYILDAQRTLSRTQAQYVDAVEAYHQAQAEVRRLTGGPADASNQTPPSGSVPEPLSQEDSHEK